MFEIPIKVATVEEAVKILASNSAIENSPIPRGTSEIAVPVQSPPRPFFALTVGINKYKNNHPVYLSNLNGCVADADAFRTFLTSKLQVPASHITDLRDAEATRANIIKSILAFAKDDRIQEGDPIVIFFAGHGLEVPAPKDWNTDDAKIQMRTTFDFNYRPSALIEEQGIPDITMSILLNELAAAKGNNITVIFDSCNSGSGTRNSGSKIDPEIRIRRALVTDDYEVLPSLKMDPREASEAPKALGSTQSLQYGLGSTRSAVIDPTLAKTGMKSHVLMAAASPMSPSYEVGRFSSRGQFTVALLDLLERVSPDTLTYKDVAYRLKDLQIIERDGRVITQYPQIEGFHMDRLLFDGRAPSINKQFYLVTKENDSLILTCGDSQGVTTGARFDLFEQRDINSEVYARASIVGAPRSVTSTLSDVTLADGSPGNINRFPFKLWAVQTHVGKDVPQIAIGVPVDPAFTPLLRHAVEDKDKRSSEVANYSLTLVDLDKPHEFGLHKTSNEEVGFDVTDVQAAALGMKKLPHTISISDVEHSYRVIKSAARFFYHFRRTARDHYLGSLINLKAHVLSQSGALWLPENVRENLAVDGVMTVDVSEDKSFGFSLTSRSPRVMFASAFLFELSDLSISSVFSPAISKATNKEGAAIQSFGELTIGYGAGGTPRLKFNIQEEDEDIQISFLKIFLSTKPVDLSYIQQTTPFSATRGDGGGIVDAVDDPDEWDTITLAIVCNRG